MSLRFCLRPTDSKTNSRTCRDRVLCRILRWVLPPQAFLLSQPHNPRRELSRRRLDTPHNSLSRSKDFTHLMDNASMDPRLHSLQGLEAPAAFPATCRTVPLLQDGSLPLGTGSLPEDLASSLPRCPTVHPRNHLSSAQVLPVCPPRRPPPSCPVETKSPLAAMRLPLHRKRPLRLLSLSLL